MKDSKKSARSIVFLGAVASLPVVLSLYVASIGPVLYADRNWNSADSPRWIEVFYWPLLAACAQSPTIEHALSRYLAMWGVA